MLRRVVRILRAGALVAGIVLLLWWPLSYVARPYFDIGWPWPKTGVALVDGRLFAVANETPLSSPRPWYNLGLLPDREVAPETSQLRPEWVNWSDPQRLRVLASIPFWLLASLCLAWPVTSFVIARRRRRGRGFPSRRRRIRSPKGALPAGAQGNALGRRRCIIIKALKGRSILFETVGRSCAPTGLASSRRRTPRALPRAPVMAAPSVRRIRRTARFPRWIPELHAAAAGCTSSCPYRACFISASHTQGVALGSGYGCPFGASDSADSAVSTVDPELHACAAGCASAAHWSVCAWQRRARSRHLARPSSGICVNLCQSVKSVARPASGREPFRHSDF
jgi:hypothetical protein